MQILPIRDMRNTHAISELCHKTEEPVFITKNGYGDMVLMSLQTYEKSFALLTIYQKVLSSEQEIANGQLLDGATVMAEMRAKYAGRV